MKNLKGNTYAFINFAEDVQDLMIEMVVNLLKHKNPYTGLTYAEEPALSFIEMQNEDDIFFYTLTNAFNACPTYRKLLVERFCRLAQGQVRLGGGAGEGVGRGAEVGREAWPTRNIVPETNPWFFGDDHLPGQKAGPRPAAARQRPVPPRSAEQVLRASSSRRSATPATRARSAARRGRPRPCCRTTTTCAPTTWSATSTGTTTSAAASSTRCSRSRAAATSPPALQQVVDRPFGLSEWIHVYPSLYSAEGPAIIAAYGMGLQGWDCSYEFQSHQHPPGDNRGLAVGRLGGRRADADRASSPCSRA